MKHLLILILTCWLGSVVAQSKTHNYSYKRAANKKILVFVAYEDTYYSEFIVMKQALEASGFKVDVASARNDSVSTYMIPSGTTIDETANTLPGSDYAAFQNQFIESFGASWDESLNGLPAFIHADIALMDVTDMHEYEALVIVGGTGAQSYLVDGDYQNQGVGGRMIAANEVQAIAERLNDLAIVAMEQGKPVMGQCHGAGIPAYWRVPGTSGPGAESLGFSILKDGQATGFPEPQTESNLASLNITHRVNDKVTVSNAHSSLSAGANGVGRIITTKDWYPQTVAHAARTLVNIIDTYPSETEIEKATSVLIIHGGAIDPNNCGAGNKQNDVPCNYGGGINIPADYTQLVSLFSENSDNDDFNFAVSDLDLSGTLPYPDNTTAIEDYLAGYDVVIFFKHWSTHLNDNLQRALVNYTDNGGGVLALHHGMYNDIDNGQSKNILVNELFGVQSAQAGWSGNLVNYQLYNVNYGHFVSTYGVKYIKDSELAPVAWDVQPLLPGSNRSLSYYQTFPIYDEIYFNLEFVGNPVFGRGINEVTPILSNDAGPSGPLHSEGFVKLVDQNLDETVGKVACFQPGERKESLSNGSKYAQVIRNAVKWLGTAYTSELCNTTYFDTSVTACNSYMSMYNTSGTYIDTLTSSLGCDSIVSLHLTIFNSDTTELEVTACNLYMFMGVPLSVSGVYTNVQGTQHGCDSLIVLNLTIKELDVSISQQMDTLIASEQGVTYQWIDCTTNEAIVGDTNQHFVPNSSGVYAVVVSTDICTDTSACYSFTSSGFNKQHAAQIRLFPNPVQDLVTISGLPNAMDTELLITNSVGKIVRREWIHAETVNLKLNLPAGMYTITLKNSEISVAKKLLLE